MAKKLICVNIKHDLVNVKNCSRTEPAFAPLRIMTLHKVRTCAPQFFTSSFVIFGLDPNIFLVIITPLYQHPQGKKYMGL